MYTLPFIPKVENRYNLTYSDVQKLKVRNRELIQEPLFYWNNQISAWCISEVSDTKWREDTFWIGIYTEDAPEYPGEFRFYFTSYAGMCGYTFKYFYNPEEIETKYDLIIQEKFLTKINQLIDMGILAKK
jgi:hypothetical protein